MLSKNKQKYDTSAVKKTKNCKACKFAKRSSLQSKSETNISLLACF